MTMGPDVRASDAEREETVESLRRHAGDGRLDVEELDRRITAAYAAKTHGELNRLTHDLPRERRSRPRSRARRDGFPEHLRSYLQVMALLVVIWALSGAGYFWPIWPMVGWGFFVFSHASAVGRTRRVRA
jgi:hypothetical protein